MVVSPGCRSPKSFAVPPETKEPKGDWARAVAEAAPFLWIGSTLAVSVAACVGGGYWLDRELGTKPVFVLGGAALGLVAVFYQLRRAYWQLTVGKK
jgi:F0F1-type ATP synthase assembly protein I